MQAEGSPAFCSVSMFWVHRQLRHHLDELGPGFLVLLEHCGERQLESAARPSRGSAVLPPCRGAWAYLAAPASDSWRLVSAPPVTGSSVPDSDSARLKQPMERATAATARPPTAATLSMYLRLPRATDRNRTLPSRGNRSPQRDVTARRPGAQRGRLPPGGELRLRGTLDPRRSPGQPRPCAVEGHTFWAASLQEVRELHKPNPDLTAAGRREPSRAKGTEPSAARQANCRGGVSWDSDSREKSHI